MRHATSKTKLHANAEATVTPVNGNLQLAAPNGYRNSLLLRQVDRTDGVNGDPGKRFYVRWLMVGRYQADGDVVAYTHDGTETLRVNVPEGTDLTDDWLQDRLDDYWKDNSENLPPDTVVIVK